MRSLEFTRLTEEDVDIDQQRSDIKNRIDSVTDSGILNKIASILRSSNLSNITKLAFSKDEDASAFIGRLSQMILDLDIPISGKIKFLREFGRTNMIKANVLFDKSNQVHSMEDWFEGSDTAKLMFKKMINDPQLQGKFAGEAGPGEVAIASFHREIQVGRTPDAGYDLMYNKQKIEVKAKTTDASGGGRWTAFDDAPFETYLNSPSSPFDKAKVPNGVRALPGKTSAVKQPSLAQVLNDPQYLKNPDAPLSQAQQKEIYKQVIKQAYQKADDSTVDDAVRNYPNISIVGLAKVAFESYKRKQGLDSMLFIKSVADGISTISFDDPEEAIATLGNSIKTGDLYVRGQKQRGMAFQSTLK